MPSTDRKTAANRLNGQKSHGPTNTTSTRYNATKHGLLSHGVTELDNAEAYHRQPIVPAPTLETHSDLEYFAERIQDSVARFAAQLAYNRPVGPGDRGSRSRSTAGFLPPQLSLRNEPTKSSDIRYLTF